MLVSKILFSSPKTRTYVCNLWNFFLFFKAWTIICHFGNFNPFSINVDYHKQVTKTSFPSQKMWTNICNFGNFFLSPKTWNIICNLKKFYPFFKNVDYYMQFLEFLSLLHKRGLSYVIYGISFSCLNKLDYHMHFLEFHSLLQKHG